MLKIKLDGSAPSNDGGPLDVSLRRGSKETTVPFTAAEEGEVVKAVSSNKPSDVAIIHATKVHGVLEIDYATSPGMENDQNDLPGYSTDLGVPRPELSKETA